MSFLKKVKDILFEEEEYTEPIKITDELKEEEPKIVKIESKPEIFEDYTEPIKEIKEEVKKPEPQKEVEPEPSRLERTFQFPDFDEEEFATNVEKPKANNNVLEFERKKTIEKRTDYGRYEKIETKEYTEKRKFKPSPIISPVYGILNQDYKAEDIVNRGEKPSNINIEEVRKKAFELPKVEKEEPKKEDIIEDLDDTKEVIPDPVVTFFEEKEEIKEPKKEDNYKSIDDLLEEASTELDVEDEVEIPKTNNLDAIEEELEKLDEEEKKPSKDLDDTLDNDLFDLIDSMYDDREEV